jgi:hypothetical protein
MNLTDVTLPAATKAAMRSVLEAELRATQTKRTRRKVGASLLAVALVAAGATAGAASFAAQEPAKDLTRISCYSSTQVSADPYLILMKELSGPFAGVNPNFEDPIGECKQSWPVPMEPLPDNPYAVRPVAGADPAPPLVACVLWDEVAVFPGGEGTCGALKLPAWNGH